MDYETLLRKYIQHVEDVEGSTFIDCLSHINNQNISHEEMLALIAIQDQLFPKRIDHPNLVDNEKYTKVPNLGGNCDVYKVNGSIGEYTAVIS